MGVGMSQEECDKSCDREIKMYVDTEKRNRTDRNQLKKEIEKYKKDIDEMKEECNKLEEECKVARKSSSKAVINRDSSDNCHPSCDGCDGPGPMDCIHCRDGSNILDKDGDGFGVCPKSVGMVKGGTINSIESSMGGTPPSKEQIEEYKLLKRLEKCRGLPPKHKPICYKRIEGHSGPLSRALQGNVKPLNIDLIKNGMFREQITKLKNCNASSTFKGIVCRMELQKMKLPNISFSKDYFNEYKHLFEGFGNLDDDYNGDGNSNDKFMIIIAVILIFLLYKCE